MMQLRHLAPALAVILLCALTLAAAPSSKITDITLERGCPGCPTGTVLILRADGTATLTRTGDERFATTNQTSKATIRPEDFARLATLIESKHFFQMKEEYADPNLQDAAWSTISVTCNGKLKKVMTHGDAAPANLQAILDELHAVEKRLFPAAHQAR
jgi:hypothetical protein